MEELTDVSYEARIASIDAGVCIFVKKLCPHCKNMMKVLEKFAGLQDGLTFVSIDIEENTGAAKALGAERAPTIVVVKGGKAVGVKTGLMNPKEMLAFYQSV